MERKRVSTDTPWEAKVGYSRAVRVGLHVFVSGTTATDAEGGIVGEGGPYQQTVQAIDNIRVALEAVGASLSDVVRTRMYVRDIGTWEEIGRAHGEAFGTFRPAATMIEVRRLIEPEMLIEIEADALLPQAAE